MKLRLSLHIQLTLVALFTLLSSGCQPFTLIDQPLPLAPSDDSLSPTETSPVEFEASAGANSLGDSIYPLMGNGGYDVNHYTLEFDVDVEANFIEATAIVNATSTQALSAFNLDFHGLTVEQITINDVDAAFSRDEDELTITPALPIPDATIFTATIDYSGSPTTIPDPSTPTAIGWHHSADGIYVVSEPAGAKTWFPNNNHPRDKATYTFRITTPLSYTTAATGIRTRFIDAGDKVTTVWEMDDPMASYLGAIYIGDYVREESKGPDGLLIRNYFPSGLRAAEKAAFANTAEIIEFYSNFFGPYPFDAYGSIVIDQKLGYALENQTLSVHGRGTTGLYVIAHEIMHQWTGNHVSPGDWQDVWLNEGFAFYIPFLYMDEIGAVEIHSLMARFYQELERRQTIGPATVSAGQLFDSNIVYRRGGLALYALHQALGDERFKTVMRTYYETYGGATATTADFITVAESIGGQNVRDLLNRWLYDEALPGQP